MEVSEFLGGIEEIGADSVRVNISSSTFAYLAYGDGAGLTYEPWTTARDFR